MENAKPAQVTQSKPVFPRPSVRILARMQSLLVDGASFAEISEHVLLPAEVVEHWIHHFHWQELVPERTTAQDIERARVMRQEKIALWQQAMAAKSSDLSLRGFALAENAIDRGDARSFGDAARGINTFAQLTRQAEGLDSKAEGGTSVTLNQFVLRVGETVREAKPVPNAEPINITPVNGAEDMEFDSQ